jgi:hypothetical protein
LPELGFERSLGTESFVRRETSRVDEASDDTGVLEPSTTVLTAENL